MKALGIIRKLVYESFSERFIELDGLFLIDELLQQSNCFRRIVFYESKSKGNLFMQYSLELLSLKSALLLVMPRIFFKYFKHPFM